MKALHQRVAPKSSVKLITPSRSSQNVTPSAIVDSPHHINSAPALRRRLPSGRPGALPLMNSASPETISISVQPIDQSTWNRKISATASTTSPLLRFSRAHQLKRPALACSARAAPPSPASAGSKMNTAHQLSACSCPALSSSPAPARSRPSPPHSRPLERRRGIFGFEVAVRGEAEVVMVSLSYAWMSISIRPGWPACLSPG